MQKKIDFRDDIKSALDALHAGGIILFPTDTGWLLGCDATNDSAVERMKNGFGKSESNFSTVITDSSAKVQGLVDEVPELAWDLMELTEKPLTIVFSNVRNLSAQILSADKVAGIRITEEVFSKNLCARFRKPIMVVAPSTENIFKSYSFSDIPANMVAAVDFVVQYRQLDKVKPVVPSVIQLQKGNLIKIIRE